MAPGRLYYRAGWLYFGKYLETERQRIEKMNRFEYIVVSIDGDYAHLKRIDDQAEESDQELKLVARALLPAEIVEGSKLLYEWMQYSIME